MPARLAGRRSTDETSVASAPSAKLVSLRDWAGKYLVGLATVTTWPRPTWHSSCCSRSRSTVNSGLIQTGRGNSANVFRASDFKNAFSQGLRLRVVVSILPDSHVFLDTGPTDFSGCRTPDDVRRLRRACVRHISFPETQSRRLMMVLTTQPRSMAQNILKEDEKNETDGA
jgi:hypothetical protein